MGLQALPRFNFMALNQAGPQDAQAKFKKMHSTKCFVGGRIPGLTE